MKTGNPILYSADLYLRVSHEDGDKTESDSITNQRDFLLAFLSSHPEISLHKVRIDDGYSGVNFERPDFIRMMESVKEKEINCIIVKDFSRLGRNFIETGKYIEKIFPFMGVRFISVNDDYDSVRPRTSSDNLMVPVKNLINDAYCCDISVKIRSHLDVKRKKGQCVAPFAVYGYQKSEENHNQLIVDEEAAAVVKEIFKQKLEGYSAQAIADDLNEQDIPSPLEYKRANGSRYQSAFQKNECAKWTAVAIFRILKNPVYIGTLVQGKSRTPNYKVKKQFAVPKEQWIAVADTQEAIISKEVFERVAAMLRSDTRTAPGKKTVYPLSGLVFCGDCGRSMIRKNNAAKENPYIYYICSGNKHKEGCKSSHSIRDKALEQAVLVTLRAVLDSKDTLSMMTRLTDMTRQVKKVEERIQKKQQEIEQYQRYKRRLYEDYANEIVSYEDYVAFGKRYDTKLKEAQNKLLLLKKEMETLVNKNTGEQKWISYVEQCQNMEALTRKLAVALIERIFIYEGKRIQIQFKFQDVYNRTSVRLEVP